MLTRDVDVAVVGSGFGGSLLAMIARRVGRSVVLLERGRHPRFAIGESSTPLANLVLEELARAYDLPAVLPLCKWGSWQRAYPEIGCGLKRGFSFMHHVAGQEFSTDASHRNQLLVAASPHDAIADTHWYRPEFDHHLVREAERMGVDYLDEVRLEGIDVTGDEARLSGTRHAMPVRVRARLVVDASGPRGFMHRALGLEEQPFAHLPPTRALYSHFRGVGRIADHLASGGAVPPYPPDDAALHHVFDGGWIWVLHFANGITSAGAALTETLAHELRLEEGAPAWERLLDRLPTVRQQFAAATPILPFVHVPRLAFRTSAMVGERWAMLPSAAGFVDPLLSMGFALTLHGVQRLAALLERWPTASMGVELRRYATRSLAELDAAERLVAALYAAMSDPELFGAVSRLYFAAVSYAESARRLGKPALAESYLLHDHPEFGARVRACLARVPATGPERAALLRDIDAAIALVDVAGLRRTDRANWYAVDAADLLAAADRFGATRTAVAAMLARCGMPAASDAAFSAPAAGEAATPAR